MKSDNKAKNFTRYLKLLSLILVVYSSNILSHNLDLNLKILSPTILKGAISFTDEDGASGQYILIENVTDTSFTILALKTNKYGEFKVTVIPGHRYRVTVEGDEDHVVSKEVSLPKLPSVN